MTVWLSVDLQVKRDTGDRYFDNKYGWESAVIIHQHYYWFSDLLDLQIYFPVLNGIWKCWFLDGRKMGEPSEKPFKVAEHSFQEPMPNSP